MATIAITPEQDAVQLEVQIAAPPERVFQAITDPRQLVQWWGQKGMYHTTNWTTDLRPGGKWLCEGITDQDGSPFNVYGEYIEVDPPRRLVHTWNASFSGPVETTVRWELEPVAGGTRVRILHTGFESDTPHAKAHGDGWTRVLGWVQAFVEKNETVASRKAFVPPSKS